MVNRINNLGIYSFGSQVSDIGAPVSVSRLTPNHFTIVQTNHRLSCPHDMEPYAARAQATAPDSAAIRAATSALKSDLRNFVIAQEAYFADSVTYARSLGQLRSLFRPTPGVTLVLLTASKTAHTEIAIIDRVPGLVCAMFIGDGPPPLGRGEEGTPVCRGQ